MWLGVSYKTDLGWGEKGGRFGILNDWYDESLL